MPEKIRLKKGPVRGRLKEHDYVIGKNIKLIRTIKDMSQQTLAKGVGISFQQIQKYEKGKNRVSVSTLLKIAEFMDVHPVSLMQDTFEQNPAALPDGVLSKEVLDMICAFNKIKDERVRNSIRSFLKSVSSEMQDETN